MPDVGLRHGRQPLVLKLAGIVAPKRDAVYLPGKRTACWSKVKRPGAVPVQRFKGQRD